MTLRHVTVEVATTLRLQCGSPLIHLGFASLLLKYMSTGKKRGVEALWRDFFSNTSEWWDHRPEKMNPRFPDFKHKQTGESLWLANPRNPTWVQAELTALLPGTLESNVFAWTQRLKRHVKAGQYKKTMEVFHQMQVERICPDARTFLPVLNACAALGALEEGKRIHTQIIRAGCESDAYVATCLVDMYAKCGSVEDAWAVFNKMREHDVVTWSAMIGGYVKSGQGLKAMELFWKMQQEGVEPNAVTFVGVLNACAGIAALDEGRRVHKQIICRGYECNVYVASCLVDMYAKCGSIEDAQGVFTRILTQNVVAWNAMMGGYAMHGHAEQALDLFKRMGKEEVEINGVTFTCLLSACNHGGLVKEGLRYFKSMTSCFDVLPTTEHYACMVDLLGRAGRLVEAEELTRRIPVKRDFCLWMSLLGACRLHGNIEMAERAAKQCWELDHGSASGHVLLWNIYAAAGQWARSADMREEKLEGKNGTSQLVFQGE